MITGFDKQTHELTEQEIKILVPLLVKGFKRHVGENNAISSTQIIKKLKERGLKTTPPRIRKMVNHIRIHGLVFHLIATSKGYFVAGDESECERHIESLDQRINSQTIVRDAMAWQLERTRQKQRPDAQSPGQ